MKKELTRRDLIGKAGLAIGGALTLSVLACNDDSNDSNTNTNTNTNDNNNNNDTCQQYPGAQVKDFPYEQHLAAGYQLDVAAVKEPAYHGYYDGGCCHGAYSALLGHLATTAGQPFNLLPLDFGKFGGGGIASYGSICGALLGSVLVTNMVVADATARSAIMTDLMRWYEGTAFPNYLPSTVDSHETGLSKDFSATGITSLKVIPNSHLCHASVSGWCAANGVSAVGADKKARCARLTADVAGKCAEMLNSYLKNKTYTAAAPTASTQSCLGCHPATNTSEPVASGMQCDSCHSDKTTGHPGAL